MIQSILKHASVRKYKTTPIPESVLNEIIEAGVRASNTGNMQLYSIIVTKSAEIKEQLAPAHFNQPMIKNAPVVLTLCADVNRFTKWCNQRNADAGFFNSESLISAIIDTCLVAQNICIAAESHGLGICYLGTTTYNPQQIIDALQLPKGVFPVTTVTMGYPDESPALSERLPLNAVVHAEKYNDYTSDAIDKAYNEIENNPANQKFITENNKQNLAQVFAEIRYSKSNNEFFSEQLMEAIKSQGLL
ncbi:MAG: NADPH-dependent oxidoreductase [Bacteroidales bacterium]|nr:NADPH-dependent oxidoreductase [Bacteroidales bacterium]